MIFGNRRRLGVALTIALLLTGCSNADNGSPATPDESTADAQRTDLSADDLTVLFADAGIGTVADPADPRPSIEVTDPTGVLLTRFQVETMARHASAGLGFRAEDIDELVTDAGVGTDAPMGIVLAAWLVAGDTPAADAAREITGEQDWEHHALELVYPDAVVTLFVADLARDADGSSGADGAGGAAFVERPGATRVVPAVAARAGICTDLTQLLTGTLDTIVSKLTIDAQDGIGGVLATIWNTVITIAAEAAKIAVAALTAPVVKVIRSAATVLAVLSSASSVLNPWSVTMEAEPQIVHFGIDPAPAPEVEVIATAIPEVAFTWPADVKDCAAAAGVPLPDPGNPEGAEVEWVFDPDPQLAQVQSKEKVTDAEGKARLRFTTGTESAADHAKGPAEVGVLTIATKVKRTQIQGLLNLVDSILITALPGPAADIVAVLLGPAMDAARTKLTGLLDVGGQFTNVIVDYHGPAVPDPTESPGVPPTPACDDESTKVMRDGYWKGPIALSVIGKGGGLEGLAASKGSGKLMLVVVNGAVTGGQWKVTWRSRGLASSPGTVVRIDLVGTIKGKVSGSAGKPHLSGNWRIAGNAHVLSPVDVFLPLDATGDDTESMQIDDVACDVATGTFLPSFNAKGSGATFTGTAIWSGTRNP